MAGSLVGRSAEYESIMRCVRAAAAGAGSAVALTGEGGIGKTALATTVAATAGEEGFAVVRGHCYEAGGAPAYWPWIEVLRSIAAWVPHDDLRARLGSRAAAVASLVPELGGAPSLSYGDDGTEEARFLLFDGVMIVLAAATEKSPLLVMIEDVHAADVPSVLLLGFVARRLSGHRATVVFTYRDVEARLKPAIDDALSMVAADTVSLRPLTRDEISEVVDRDDVSAIYEASGGNPLIARELAAFAGSGQPRLVPASARAMFTRRLEMLDAEARAAIESGAVLGVEFDVALLAAITGLSFDSVLGALGGAMRAGILAESPFPAGSARFRHSLIRDAIYESMEPQLRAERHAAAATVLQGGAVGKATVRLAALARHALLAVPVAGWRSAVDAGRQAAEAAMDLFAFEDAVRLLGDSLSVVPVDEEEVRLELLLDLGTASALSRYQDEAQAYFDEAETLARRTANPMALVRVALSGGVTPLRTFSVPGTPDPRLISLLEEALELLPHDEEVLRAKVMTRLAGQLWWVPGTHDRRDVLTRAAADIAREIGHDRLLAGALHARYATLALPPDEADSAAREGVAAYEACGDVQARGQAEVLRAQQYLSHGEIVSAEAAVNAAIAFFDQFGSPYDMWQIRCLSFVFPFVEGRFQEAEEMLADHAEACTRLGIGDRGLLMLEILRTMIVRRRFRRAELEQLADLMLALSRANPGMSPWLPATSLVLSWIGDGRGEELARQVVENLGSLPREFNWSSTLAILADAMAMTRMSFNAHDVHDLLLPFEGRAALISSMDVYSPFDRALGNLERLMERWDDAERHFESAVAMDTRMRAWPSLVQTELHYAQMLVARGTDDDKRRAGALVADALRRGEELGMTDLRGIVAEAYRLDVTSRRSGRLAQLELGKRGATDVTGEVVIAREGDVWSVVRSDASFRVRDSKGMQQLAFLLAQPGKEVHVLDLAAPRADERDRAMAVAGSSSVGAALDDRAKKEYRRRIDDLREEIDDAERCADIARAEKARQELDFLLEELSGAVGLGGRDRPTASNAERARVAVTKTIKAAIDRIADHDDDLGAHLRSAVSTGLFCSYQPDPTSAVRVTVESR